MTITFISELLHQRHPRIAASIETVCREENAIMLRAAGTNDIWMRDYMPIVLPDASMVRFQYTPSYLIPGHEELVTRFEDVSLGFQLRMKRSKIRLDGGNYVRLGNKVLLCDRILDENPDIPTLELLNQLSYLLKASELILLPTHPHDPTGHADGIVARIDDSTVLIDRLHRASSSQEITFHNNLKEVLLEHHISFVEAPVDLPSTPYQGEWDCRGSYLNMVKINKSLLIPVYTNSNLRKLRSFFSIIFRGVKVQFVNCENLARDGGALHCITWVI